MAQRTRREQIATIEDLLELGQLQGYVTFDDILAVLPEAEEDLDTLEMLYRRLEQLDIEIVDQDLAALREGEEGDLEAVAPLRGLDDIESDDALTLYMREVGHTPLLTPEEEIELAKRMEEARKAEEKLRRNGHRDQDRRELEMIIQQGEKARQQLIRANARLVMSIAKRYRGQGVPFLDLIQEGNLGLMKAAEKYDYRKGYKFSTYATWWIRQAMTRALAGQGRTIRMPVHMNERVRRLYATSQRLEQELGRRPTPEELAQEMGLPLSKIRRMIHYSQRTVSLEKPVGEEGDSELGQFIESEEAPDPADVATRELLRQDLEEMFAALTPREVRVLELRFGLRDGHSYTLKEIGKKFGLTRERIRQIEQEALAKLRKRHRAKQLEAYLESS